MAQNGSSAWKWFNIIQMGKMDDPSPPQKKIVGLKAKKNVKNEDRPKIATSWLVKTYGSFWIKMEGLSPPPTPRKLQG